MIRGYKQGRKEREYEMKARKKDIWKKHTKKKERKEIRREHKKESERNKEILKDHTIETQKRNRKKEILKVGQKS